MGPGAVVGDVMTRSVPVVPAEMTVREGLAVLAQTDFPALPVTSPEGRFLGTVGRADLLKRLYHKSRPKQIGGMATPLGVYLSDGTYRGGVGDLGLVLTGLFLFVGSVVAGALAILAATYWTRYGLPRLLPPQTVSVAVWLIAFALWFRLSWVAGYHAAEHQTVHAIERNEPLTPERVSQMPRTASAMWNEFGCPRVGICCAVRLVGRGSAGCGNHQPGWLPVPWSMGATAYHNKTRVTTATQIRDSCRRTTAGTLSAGDTTCTHGWFPPTLEHGYRAGSHRQYWTDAPP